MRTRTRIKIDPDAVYQAWQGSAVGTFTIPKGTRLRGAHEAVKL